MPEPIYPDKRKKFPKVLAFDTSGPFVSVGWATQSYSGGSVLEMARGQAEGLFPAIEKVLSECKWTWQDIDTIGVAVGPGNFTGIRISVSAARGLGLALGIPVFAVDQFELAYGSTPVHPGTLVSVAAPRGMAYVRGHGVGDASVVGKGLLVDPEAPPPELQLSFGMEVHGYRAVEIAVSFEAAGYDEDYKPDPARLAEITETKYLAAKSFPDRPAPLYLRPADAAPARDAPPVILP